MRGFWRCSSNLSISRRGFCEGLDDVPEATGGTWGVASGDVPEETDVGSASQMTTARKQTPRRQKFTVARNGTGFLIGILMPPDIMGEPAPCVTTGGSRGHTR